MITLYLCECFSRFPSLEWVSSNSRQNFSSNSSLRLVGTGYSSKRTGGEEGKVTPQTSTCASELRGRHGGINPSPQSQVWHRV